MVFLHFDKKSYIAGVFDVRGFVRIDPKYYSYMIHFNITESELKYWEEFAEILRDLGFNPKIYPKEREKARKKGRQREFSLVISGKREVYRFLNMIVDVSLRKEEIKRYMEKLERLGRKIY